MTEQAVQDLLRPDMVAVAAAAVSLIALVFNLAMWRRHVRTGIEVLKFSNDGHLMAWANRVLAAMSEAQHLCAATNVGPLYLNERALALATTLSALMDEGRWFFPQTPRPTADHNKPTRSRAPRQTVIEQLSAVYDSVNELQRLEEPAKEALMARIGEARRQFVAEVQHAIDPRRRRWVMDRIRNV